MIHVLSMDDKPALQATAINASNKNKGWFARIAPGLIELYYKPELRKPLIIFLGQYGWQSGIPKKTEEEKALITWQLKI